MAFGSCAIALARPPRLLLQVLLQSPVEPGNPVVDCLQSACGCCRTCYGRILRFLTKSAYLDVAFSGNEFCQASHTAVLVLEHEATAAARLSGAVWLLQVSGLGAIATLGSCLSYVILRGVTLYSSRESEFFVENPFFLSSVAFMVGFEVARPFMLVFDQASDTMLYCFANEHIHNPQLAQLVEFGIGPGSEEERVE